MPLKQVYLAENAIDAQLLCDMLSEAGFEAKVFGSYLTGAVGEIPPDGLIKVMVKFAGNDRTSPDTSMPVGKWHIPHETADAEESDDPPGFKAARQVVAEFEATRTAQAWPRVCKRCGEDSNSRFSHCWSCGAPLDP